MICLPPSVTPSDEEPIAAGGVQAKLKVWNRAVADNQILAAARDAVG